MDKRDTAEKPKYAAGIWLLLYFSFSLMLTIYNKMVMQMLSFHYPWLLTSVHTLCAWIGCHIFSEFDVFTPSRVTTDQAKTIRWFSILYTVNIAASNISLNLVTVPFHQVVRATVPIITMIFSRVFLNVTYSREVYMSLIPVVLGVPLATYGEYKLSILGLVATFIGAVLASVKTIVTNKLQAGNFKFHPLDLLYQMSPLAFLQTIVWAFLVGEVGSLHQSIVDGTFGGQLSVRDAIYAILFNGVIAFGLNYVSFTANGKTSPLMMCVAGNMKQVMSIILSVIIFGLHISGSNGLGILLTLVGGAWYTVLEMQRKRRAPENGPIICPPEDTQKDRSSNTSIQTKD